MVEQNAFASQSMAGEADRLRKMFSSKQVANDESTSRITAGKLVSGPTGEQAPNKTASALTSQKKGTEQKVPQIEMPEWEKEIDNFK